MTDLTPDHPAPAQHEPMPCEHDTSAGAGLALCGETAEYATSHGPRCAFHAPTGDRTPIAAPPVGKILDGGDAMVRRTDALVSAIAGAKGNADDKARYQLDNLDSAGWVLLHHDDGTPVSLAGDEQVVEVPDGYVAMTVAQGDYVLHGPASGLDPELDLMTVVAQHLRRIGPDAAARCVDYWADRFNPATPGGWVDITPRTVSLEVTGPAPRWSRDDTSGTAAAHVGPLVTEHVDPGAS